MLTLIIINSPVVLLLWSQTVAHIFLPLSKMYPPPQPLWCSWYWQRNIQLVLCTCHSFKVSGTRRHTPASVIYMYSKLQYICATVRHTLHDFMTRIMHYDFSLYLFSFLWLWGQRIKCMTEETICTENEEIKYLRTTASMSWFNSKNYKG